MFMVYCVMIIMYWDVVYDIFKLKGLMFYMVFDIIIILYFIWLVCSW